MGSPSVARGAAIMGRVATFAWNGGQACDGISGSFRMELVAVLPLNQWQVSPGIGGSFTVEYVPGGQLPDGRVSRLCQCAGPHPAGPRALTARGVDRRPRALPAGRDLGGAVLCHHAAAGPASAGPGFPRGDPRHLGYRGEPLWERPPPARVVGSPTPGISAGRLGPGICLVGRAITPGHNDPGRPAGRGLDAAQCGRWHARSAVVRLALAAPGRAPRAGLAALATGPAQRERPG
jgi:hypothetical protein